MTIHQITDSPNVAVPVVSPDAPFPGRRTVRSWLIPLSSKETLQPLLLLTFDTALFIALIGLTVWLSWWPLKLVFGLMAGFVIGRLFILGHDACHQSLTPSRNLNKTIGRFAFLFSLTPYSLWDVGHNVVHHGQTNLKGFDFVWAPYSVEEFKALSPVRRALEKIYRNGWAPGLYYFIEMWWNRMYFPSKAYMGAKRPAFMWDGVLVTVFAFIWNALLIVAAVKSNQSVLLTITMGFAVPFAFWNFMIGFVVYAHHTHTSVAWYDNKSEWTAAQPYVSTTVHLIFRFKFGALMHHIMEHTAHHLDSSIPLYRLKDAQQFLETHLPGRIIVQPFSWKWYFETARLCKLYDFKNKCWLDFSGKPTSASLAQAA